MQGAQELQEQWNALQQQLTAAKEKLSHTFEEAITTDGEGAPDPKADLLLQQHSLADVLRYLCSLVHTQQYVRDVQSLVNLVRAVEKSTRSAKLAAQDVDAFLDAAMELGVLYQQAAAAEIAATTNPAAGHELYPLQKMVTAASSRIQATREWVLTSLKSHFQTLATECGWPPPLVSADHDESHQSSSPSFTLPSPSSNPSVARWLRVMHALTALQLSMEAEAFQPYLQGTTSSFAEAPLLWMSQQLAQPVQQWLSAHFDSSLQTGRLDKPEWLFTTALRITKQLGPSLGSLQATLVSAGVGKSFHITLEFGRAMREAVKQLLQSSKLPEIESSGQPALWLHMVNSMISFEEKLAPLLGIFLREEKTLPLMLLKGSTLSLFSDNEAWLTGWIEAEQAVLQQQLEPLLFNDTAWQPSTLQVSDAEEDEDLVAWQREFLPNGLSEQVLDMLEQVVARSRYIPSSVSQLTFVKGVGKEVLRTVHARFLKILQQAETFQDMCSANWAPKVGACICGAHWLEQQIQDTIVPLLLLSLHDDAGMTDPINPQTTGNQLAAPIPSSAAASRVLAREAAAFSACRREWCLKLAKFIAQSFADKAAAYRKRVDAFGLQGEDNPHRATSPTLVLALAHLRDLLDLVSRVLDQDCFRDVWKAVAMAANRLMYNDIATEAKFSLAGAQQFAVDCSALLELFSPYTARPAAHFKELLEASRLLTLPAESAAALLAAVSKANKNRKRAEAAEAAMQEAGLMHLKPDMVKAVLQQRV